MVGITHVTRDHVTVTLKLPAGGIPFEELTRALKDIVSEQARTGNDAAAQTLHAMYVLAERGRIALMADVAPTIFGEEAFDMKCLNCGAKTCEGKRANDAASLPQAPRGPRANPRSGRRAPGRHRPHRPEMGIRRAAQGRGDASIGSGE